MGIFLLITLVVLHAEDTASYAEYDFHKETKGMHYENIASLVTGLSKIFETQGYVPFMGKVPSLTWHSSFTWFSGDVLMSKQKSVFRVNCIDCLDRTNVVQVCARPL